MMIRFYFDRFTHDLYMKQATASVPLSRCNNMSALFHPWTASSLTVSLVGNPGRFIGGALIALVTLVPVAHAG